MTTIKTIHGSAEPSHSPAPGGAGSTDSRLEIDGSRPRQTERPATPFRSVLAGGVSVLMSGAEVATHVIAGPILAAAVHDARVGATGALAGPAPGLASPAPGLAGPGMGTTGVSTAVEAAAGGAGAGTPASMQSMMQEGQASNLQLLALQQQIQEESQRFSTVSNVMRAKFDTAKAAVSNIRA